VDCVTTWQQSNKVDLHHPMIEEVFILLAVLLLAFDVDVFIRRSPHCPHTSEFLLHSKYSSTHSTTFGVRELVVTLVVLTMVLYDTGPMYSKKNWYYTSPSMCLCTGIHIHIYAVLPKHWYKYQIPGTCTLTRKGNPWNVSLISSKRQHFFLSFADNMSRKENIPVLVFVDVLYSWYLVR
jgi:hypothetical protein